MPLDSADGRGSPRGRKSFHSGGGAAKPRPSGRGEPVTRVLRLWWWGQSVMALVVQPRPPSPSLAPRYSFAPRGARVGELRCGSNGRHLLEPNAIGTASFLERLPRRDGPWEALGSLIDHDERLADNRNNVIAVLYCTSPSNPGEI